MKIIKDLHIKDEPEYLYGAFSIAKFLGEQRNYIKVGALLSILGVPKVKVKSIETYRLTKTQALMIKSSLLDIKNKL